MSSSSSLSWFERIPVVHAPRPLDTNIRPRYSIEAAAWIWHPAHLNETVFLEFRLPFVVKTARAFTFHVSADQRYQLLCDGRTIGFGPDRSDVDHWNFHTYQGWLEPGKHELSALVWWISNPSTGIRQPDSYDVMTAVIAPMAQASFRGGFLFCADEDGGTFNTGKARWQVSDLTDAVSLKRKRFPTYHAIGPSFEFAMNAWTPQHETDACIVREPVSEHRGGVARPGWRLEPTPFPEQKREEFQEGCMRLIAPTQDIQPWNNLVTKGEPLSVPAASSVSVLWDLEAYLCGYPQLIISKGAGASIRLEWAEALYDADHESTISERTQKGQRNDIAGKLFFGFGDRWLADGRAYMRLPSLWWRSGRFIRIEIQTGEEPLVIEKLAVLTTRYPLEWEGAFSADDRDLNQIAQMCARTMQAGTHETLIDSPYYEQLSYVGDNLVQALVSYALSADSRPARRSIELFDWSRQATGLVAERWPSALRQTSGTYAMLWPQMVRNHAWWRDDEAFVRELIPGIRCLIETLLPLLNPDGSMGVLPGWSFVDWTSDWNGGCPPGYERGDSAIVTLHWIACLAAAESLECAFGEPEMAARLHRFGETARIAFHSRYWDRSKNLFTDDSTRSTVSEQTNAVAAGLGLGGADFLQTWPRRLQGISATRCSVYFLHYYFDALGSGDHGSEFFEKLELWRDFLKWNLLTIPEQPEPSRSDCHPWGSHPLFHFHATLAGIRPSAPGFSRVRMHPMPGPLKTLRGRMPHPKGEIRYELAVHAGAAYGEIYLPPDTTGDFLGRFGKITPLNSGRNVIAPS
ncbi:MAG: alpha-L-rhamnosidase C-terminal domain-containing protein [Chthoniobacteraceae bacterium]